MLLKSLYKINQTINSDNISVTVHLNKNHQLYNGHFPNQPITAGAAMLQILKELVEEGLKMDLLMREASNLKFLAVVDPNENPELIYDFTVERIENEFKIKNSTSFPDGNVVFKCSATFTPL